MQRKMPLLKTVCLLTYVTIAFGMEARDMELILRTHNNLRRSFAYGVGMNGIKASNMKKLEWSESLEQAAEQSLDCGLIVSNPSSEQIHTNVGISRQRNITQIILSWINERRHFIPRFRTCVHLSECRRFLTMINSQQQKIGCAITNRCRVRSEMTHLLVCKYEGGQSIVSPFETGLPCSGCDNTTPFCDNGLCVACNTSSNSCDCQKTCNKHNIGSGTLDRNTCTCNCTYGQGPNCDRDCVNPQMYVDFDICALITQEECNSPFEEERELLREMCPATCSCRRHPSADGSAQNISAN